MLTNVDVASRYKEPQALTDKISKVGAAFSRIYQQVLLTRPSLMQVDPGCENMGALTKLLIKHNVKIYRGRVDTHQDQGFVKRLSSTLAERIFGQCEQEFLLAARRLSKRSPESVKALPEIIPTLNNEKSCLIGKKPSNAIYVKSVAQGAACKNRLITRKCRQYITTRRI